MTYVRDNNLIRAAFPICLRHEVDAILNQISGFKAWDAPVNIQSTGDKLAIPYRILGIPTDLEKISSKSQKYIFMCLHSRSTDGYNREAAIKYLSSLPRIPVWIAHYLFLSVSDYVIQVARIVSTKKQDDNEFFLDIINRNPKIYNQTLARSISYWNVYYRGPYPKLDNYPPYRFINSIAEA